MTRDGESQSGKLAECGLATPVAHAIPSVDRLLLLIDAELVEARSQQGRPGWTPWALAGAAGAILWLLSQEIEKSRPPFWTSALAMLGFWLVFDATHTLKELVANPVSNALAGRKAHAHRLMGNGRMVLIALFIKAIVLWVIAFHFREEAGLLSHLAVNALLGLYCLLAFVFFALSWTNTPVSLGTGSTLAGRILMVVLFLLAVAGMYGYGSAFMSRATVESARAGGLVAALLIVLSAMAAVDVENPLVPALVNVRRELLLGRISAAAATKQVDIATSGMYLEDVYLEPVRDLLGSLSEACSVARLSEDELNAVERGLSEVTTAEQRTLLRATVGSAQRHCEEAITQIEKSQRKYGELLSNIRMQGKLDRHCSDRAAALESKITAAWNETLLLAKATSTRSVGIARQLLQGSQESEVNDGDGQGTGGTAGIQSNGEIHNETRA